MSSLSHTYVVGHAGRRDYYQVAAALAAEGRLDSLVTDVYCPDLLASLARRMPEQVRDIVLRRRAPGLSSRYVSLRDEAALVATRADVWLGRRPRRAGVGRTVGIRAARIAAGKGCGAVIYGYNWQGFVSATYPTPLHAPHVLFLSHPIPSLVRDLVRQDRTLTNIWTDLEAEEEQPDAEIERQELAFAEADGAIVPSSFVRSGLVSRGMSPDRVKVVPYGGDMTARVRVGGSATKASRPPGMTLRLLWVGQLTYRKGPHHLAAALKMLGRHDLWLTVVAYHRRGLDPFRSLPGQVEWRERVSDNELALLFRTHDVLVLPSLAEGFGLVYAEALYAGLPIIATPNTGAPDIVTHGEGGLLINAGDPAALANAISMLADDPRLLTALKQGAASSGGQWTWGRFRAGVIAAINDLET